MRTRRISITGANGQLGRALVKRFSSSHDVDQITRPLVDILDWRAVRDRFAATRPDLVIHAAAATDVDACEHDPDAAFATNALGARNVARAAAMAGAELVHVSTNYVFDGLKSGPYHEFDLVGPVSVYGASKLAGEIEAMYATSRCHVVRTAWLFDVDSRNFVTTMRRLMNERDHLTVVDDQRGNPTFAGDLAIAIESIVDRSPYGIHHVVNSGDASWYEWAREVASITQATTTIDPIPASQWPRPATPPANGSLISLSLPAAGITLPDWHDALHRCIVG